MFGSMRRLTPPDDRGPLRVAFILTSMPVGGAETLLVNLVRRMDRARFSPEFVCLKELDELGKQLAKDIPGYANLIANKYDVRVLGRLTHIFRERRIDAVVTVGTGGDRMFWGRLAAWRAGVPVVLSALHSTGLPNRVEWQNRLLARWTDGFIAVAEPHARYLASHEGCPADKVFVVPNGVDVERFRPLPDDAALRAEIGLPPGAPVAAIVAALRPEKNHELFLRAAAYARASAPDAHFLVIGDGRLRSELEQRAFELGVADVVHFLGTRADVPELLGLVDTVVLSSHMEANPVSIIEALACEKPVVATHVGSVPETVRDGETGFLVPPGDDEAMSRRIVELFADPLLREKLGKQGRANVVANWSLERMVTGYQDLIHDLYAAKCRPLAIAAAPNAPDRAPQSTARE